MYAWRTYTCLFDSMISTNAYLISIDLDMSCNHELAVLQHMEAILKIIEHGTDKQKLQYLCKHWRVKLWQMSFEFIKFTTKVFLGKIFYYMVYIWLK